MKLDKLNLDGKKSSIEVLSKIINELRISNFFKLNNIECTKMINICNFDIWNISY